MKEINHGFGPNEFFSGNIFIMPPIPSGEDDYSGGGAPSPQPTAEHPDSERNMDEPYLDDPYEGWPSGKDLPRRASDPEFDYKPTAEAPDQPPSQ